MILVIGASGRIGSEAIKILVGRGIPVRAFLHLKTLPTYPENFGVETVQGRLEDPSALEKAMKGISQVLLVTPGMPFLELPVIKIAQRNPQLHVVKISNYNPSENSSVPWRRWHWEVEQFLIASEIPFTIIRPNFFMQNLLAHGPQLKKTSELKAPMAGGQIGMIDSRDVSLAAVNVLENPSPHRNQIYTVTGPELLSYSQVAETISRKIGKQIRYIPITIEENRAALTSVGMPKETAEAISSMYRLLAENEAAVTTTDLEKILGRPGRSLSTFVDEHINVF